MTLEEMRDLLDYTEWATAALADAIGALPDAARRRHDDSAFGNLLGTFTHLVAAEWVWLERWRRRAPAGPPAWVGVATFEEVRERLASVQRERAEWRAALGEPDLARPIAYRTFAGVAHEDRIGEMVRHVVNHGTYHRGQLAMRLRQFGAVPPSTDYIVWLRRRREEVS